MYTFTVLSSWCVTAVKQDTQLNFALQLAANIWQYYHLHCSSCSLLCWNQNCYHKLHQSEIRKKLCFVSRSWSMPALTSGVQHCGFVFHLTEASRCTVCVLMISDIPICAAEGRFHIIKSLFYIYKKQLRGLATIATKCFFLFLTPRRQKQGPWN